jgi:Spy/CpxP family protein refolding chaperone
LVKWLSDLFSEDGMPLAFVLGRHHMIGSKTLFEGRIFIMRSIITIIIAIASVALIGLAINAFAHGGMGWGGGWGHHGMHYRGDYGPGYDNPMSKEQYEKFEGQREEFFEQTRDMRASLYEKERALQEELAKENPDAAKASGLQKEISEIQAQLDQKRVDHMIEMRKLNPNMDRGGYGYMHGGPMMGYGPRGGGYCW